MADVQNQRIGISAFGFPGVGPSFQSHTVDASNEGVAWAFQADDSGAITHLGFRYGARTGTPPAYTIGLESLDLSNGNPDGTVLGGGTPASVAFTPPADTTWNGIWKWLPLDNPYTPTRGQRLCSVIRYSSGTIDGSNCSSFTTHINTVTGSGAMGHAYAIRNTSGSWAKQTSAPCYGARTASSRYGFVIESLYNTSSASTVGHRVALEFSLPSGMCSSFTVKGIRFSGALCVSGAKTPVLKLWDASSVLQDATLDADASVTPTNSNVLHQYHFDETTLATLMPGTTYYCGLEVADASLSGVLINGVGVNAADDLLAHAGGTGWRLATYDGSSWTSVTTVRPFAELILGDVTGGGGSSGGLLLPCGFTGGFNRL